MVGALDGVRKMGKGDGLGWETKQERKLSEWVNFRGLERVEAGSLGVLFSWVLGEMRAKGKLVA